MYTACAPSLSWALGGWWIERDVVFSQMWLRPAELRIFLEERPGTEEIGAMPLGSRQAQRDLRYMGCQTIRGPVGLSWSGVRDASFRGSMESPVIRWVGLEGFLSF